MCVGHAQIAHYFIEEIWASVDIGIQGRILEPIPLRYRGAAVIEIS